MSRFSPSFWTCFEEICPSVALPVCWANALVELTAKISENGARTL